MTPKCTADQGYHGALITGNWTTGCHMNGAERVSKTVYLTDWEMDVLAMRVGRDGILNAE